MGVGSLVIIYGALVCYVSGYYLENYPDLFCMVSGVCCVVDCTCSRWWWWWCRPHPVREHAQDLRPPLRARPASPPTRQAAQLPPRGPSTNPRPLV